jgi:hypothetical protein
MNEILRLQFKEKDVYLSVEMDNVAFDQVTCFEDVLIYFNNDKKYLLNTDCLHYSLYSLWDMLSVALKNKFSLSESISCDLGYLWNEYLQNNIDNVNYEYKVIENQKIWIGQEHLLWETAGSIKPKLNTWIYNDKQGNIIFEITPSYYWKFIDSLADEQDYITYEEFIKNYKPLLIEKISKETAKEWIKKIDELMKIIESNEVDKDAGF